MEEWLARGITEERGNRMRRRWPCTRRGPKPGVLICM